MMYKGKRIFKIFAGLLLSVSFVLLFLPPVFQVYPNVVLSGSMEPEIPVGSLAYIAENIAAEGIEKEDVIAYELLNGTKILHRVTNIDAAECQFTTKGDANETEDLGKVNFTQYQGKYLFCIPLAGYIITFFSNQYILGTVIAVCAGYVLVDIVFDRKEQKVHEKYD